MSKEESNQLDKFWKSETCFRLVEILHDSVPLDLTQFMFLTSLLYITFIQSRKEQCGRCILQISLSM